MTFADFARANGVLIDRLYDDGKIHRCGTVEHPRSKNGAYVYAHGRGWVMAWDSGEGVRWFGEEKEWTPEEKAEWKARRDEARRYQERQHRKAIERAQALVDASTLERHGYLRRKGFPDATGLVTDETLVIPMRDDRSNELLGAQTIRWDGAKWIKKMIYGMRARGAVFRLGRSRVETILCEGYATGLSIMAAVQMMRIDSSVLVCFSAQNMRHVAESLAGRIFVAADNDASETGERIAELIGKPWAMPSTLGQDFNDMHQSDGLVAVCRVLMDMRRSMR